MEILNIPAVNKYKEFVLIVENYDQFITTVNNIKSSSEFIVNNEMIRLAKENTREHRAKIIYTDLQRLEG